MCGEGAAERREVDAGPGHDQEPPQDSTKVARAWGEAMPLGGVDVCVGVGQETSGPVGAGVLQGRHSGPLLEREQILSLQGSLGSRAGGSGGTAMLFLPEERSRSVAGEPE